MVEEIAEGVWLVYKKSIRKKLNERNIHFIKWSKLEYLHVGEIQNDCG